MDEGKGRNFGDSKRLRMLIIPLCALLLGSLSWNVWQYRLATEQRLQAVAAEQAAVTKANQTKLDAEQRKLKKARDAKSGERVQQLYREIDNLTRINERVQMPKPISGSAPAKTDDLQRAVNAPP
jgi:hypothetical protein